MASCKLGHVYIVKTVLSKPPKEKFAMCVCIANGYFFWINTRPAPHGRDQLPLSAGCHELVTHDSHLDLSKIFCHPDWEMDAAKEFPMISESLCNEITAAIETGLPAYTTAMSMRRRKERPLRHGLSRYWKSLPIGLDVPKQGVYGAPDVTVMYVPDAPIGFREISLAFDHPIKVRHRVVQITTPRSNLIQDRNSGRLIRLPGSMDSVPPSKVRNLMPLAARQGRK